MNQFNSKQHCMKKQNKKRTLQEEFVHHCAVFIQSRVRGYLQRKRYKSFLPIYRRVKELFLALFNGWRVRKIMKLPPIKNQVGDIRLKMKNGQVSSARIAKRELWDELERLGKKGRWVEVVQRYRMIKSKNALDGKENSSLYGNIKSKSIRNVFKDQPQAKIDKQRTKVQQNMKKSLQTSHNQFLQKEQAKQAQIDVKKIENFDQKPIKGIHSISICETEPEAAYNNTQKDITKRQYLKKQQKDIKKSNPKTAKGINQRQRQADPSKAERQTMPDILSARPVTQSDPMKCSQISKSSQNSKRLHITLANNLTSSIKTTQSFKPINQSSMDMKALQASRASLAFSNRKDTTSVQQVYYEKYLQQKSKIMEKLKNLDLVYTQGVSKDYKKWLSKC